MIKYKKNELGIITLIIVLAAEILLSIIDFKKKDIIDLIWLVPGFLITLIATVSIYQMEIVIDDEKITINYGLPFLFKPKTMNWKNVDYVLKDNLFTIGICRLISNGQIKAKTMNFSEIKNMNSMIVEIVKRAKYANISPEFQKLVKKDK